MSIQSIQSSINSVRRDIADLQKQTSDELRKEADLSQRVARLQGGIRSGISPGSLQSKLREIARLQDDIARIQAKKADHQKRLADKTSRLCVGSAGIGKAVLQVKLSTEIRNCE